MLLKLKKINILNKHKEADQLAIFKHDQGAELGSTEKQLQLSDQSGSCTRDLLISSPVL